MTRDGWEGSSALVTGASRGIGRAVAIELANRGVRLGLLGRDRAALEATARDCRSIAPEGTHVPLVAVADLVRDGEAVATHVTSMLDEFEGSLRVLANVAGAPIGTLPPEQLDVETWTHALQLNLIAPAHLAATCFEALVAAKGTVVNVGSIASQRAAPLSAAYAAAKAGLASLTRSQSVEWARHGVRAITVEPGYVRTDFNARLIEAGLEGRLLDRIPVREAVTPAEVARCVVFAADPTHRSLTGSSIVVDGGFTARL